MGGVVRQTVRGGGRAAGSCGASRVIRPMGAAVRRAEVTVAVVRTEVSVVRRALAVFLVLLDAHAARRCVSGRRRDAVTLQVTLEHASLEEGLATNVALKGELLRVLESEK